MNLVFIRHGMSDHNKNGYYDSSLNSKSSLTEEGIKVINDSALEIKHFDIKIENIYSSPLKRCIETSKILRKILDIRKEIVINHNLREIEMGDYDGSKVEKFPYGNYNFQKAALYGGETLEDVDRRVHHFLKTLKENSLIVTHQGPIRVAIRYLKNEDIKIGCGKYIVVENWKNEI
jgi:broad specificity phosphatase PhoE